MRRYIVKVEGFDGVEVEAKTASKAKAEIFRRVNDAGWDYTFREFLSKVSVLHMGPVTK